MAKLSNKKIVDLINTIKYNAEEFNPECNCFDKIFYEDKNFFKYAVYKNGNVLQYGSDDFKSDKEIVTIATTSNSQALQYATDELKADKEFIAFIVKTNPYAFEFASEELKNDKEFVLELAKYSKQVFAYASDEVIANIDFLEFFSPSSLSVLLEYRYNAIKTNRKLLLEILKVNGYFLKLLSDEDKNDIEIVQIALKDNKFAYQYISKDLKKNKKLLLLALEDGGEILEYAIDSFKADREVAELAVSKHGGNFALLSDELKHDKILIKLALRSRSQIPDAIEAIPRILLEDREFAKELLYIEPDIFDKLSDNLKNDLEFKLIYKLGGL